MMREFDYAATFLRRAITVAFIGVVALLMEAQAGNDRASDSKDEKPQAPSNDQSILSHAKPGSARLCVKTRKLIIPQIDFSNSTVRECINSLEKTSRELEKGSYGFADGGVMFVVYLSEEEIQRLPRVNFHAENVALLNAVDEVARQTRLDYRVASYAIELGNSSDFADKLPEQLFIVPPAVFPECQSNFPQESELGKYVRFDVRQRLGEWGIEVTKEGAAYYFPSTFELRVSGPEEQLEAIDGIVNDLVTKQSFPPEKQIKDPGVPGSGPRFGVRPRWRASQTWAKLQRIILPRVEMREATAAEAFEFFFRKTAELDTLEPKEVRRGVRGSLSPDLGSISIQPTITLSLQNIPAADALAYITKIARLDCKFQQDGSVLVQPRSNAQELETETYCVPTQGINLAAGSIAGPDGVTYRSAQDLFSAFGVLFPEGASAGLTTDGEIVVRNTEQNLAVTDVIVAALIDSGDRKLSAEHLAALRAIIADARAHGRIRLPTTLGFGEG